jgi:hypothetical protein
LFYCSTILFDAIEAGGHFDFAVRGGRLLLPKSIRKEDTMSVESIEQVIKRWETGEITPEQVIGKILLWLLELYRRMLKLEAKQLGQNKSQ